MSTLYQLLACPRCDAKPLVASATVFSCKACKTSFPILDGIPFLCPAPDVSLAEWRERLNRLLVQFEYDVTSIHEELNQPKLLLPTQRRLKHMAACYSDQAQRLRQLLRPLDIEVTQASFETHLALRTRLPPRQGLTTYYANMHRDWCWGTVENELSVQRVERSIGKEAPGKMLVLGAGAGRLAYDVHQQCKPEITVALDINPLLFLVANKVMQGEEVNLYEFPIAPKTIDDHAVLRRLSAPDSVSPGFHFVLADALYPPFVPGSFDVIITPWLLDILPEDLRAFASRVNRLLRIGGKWINFGSLSFAHERWSSCYSLEEVALIVAEAGFQNFTVEEGDMPYMQSPASRHSRVENVLSFSALKHKKLARPSRYQALPDWIVKGNEPVPLSQSFQAQAMATRIHAFIMALIDGKRSVKDMAIVLEQQRLMPREEAESAIRSFLTKMHEENMRVPNF